MWVADGTARCGTPVETQVKERIGIRAAAKGCDQVLTSSDDVVARGARRATWRFGLLGAGIAALLCAMITACSSSGTSRAAAGSGSSGASGPVSFTVGVAPGIPVAAAYAMPKYAPPNVKITDVPVASGPVELAGLLSGQIQVAPIGYTTYIQALAKGDKLTAVAGVANGGLEIVASKKIIPAGDINAAQAAYTGSAPWTLLAGKTIATLPGTYPDMACRQYLDSHGIDLSQIKFVTAASFSEEMNLVEDGTADAACGLDPWPLAARAANQVVLLGFPYPSLDNYLAYSTVLAVATDEVSSHPAVVQAAVDALVKATTVLNEGDNKPNLVATIATYLPVPKNILALGVSTAATSGKDPQFWYNTILSNDMNNKSTAQLVPLELNLGLIQGSQTAIENTVTASFDYSFLAKATGKTPADLGSEQ